MTEKAAAVERRTAPIDTGGDYATRKFNEYLVEAFEELTGYRLRMSHLGPVFADRTHPVSPAEEAAGVLRTLGGAGGPKVLVEAIHEQTRTAQAVAMRDAVD